MRFISENFSFDNISNKEMSVDLVTFGDDFFNEIGIAYNDEISLDSSFASNPYYLKENSESDEFTLNMMLVNEAGSQKKWDNKSMLDIMDWLVTDTFKPFISEDSLDVVYYLKVTKIVKKFTPDMYGYLEVTVKSYSNYAYYKVEASGTSNINIVNISNVDSDYKPVIKVTGVNGNVSIRNGSSDALTLSEVTGDIIIDCALCTVKDTQGNNLFSKCNRKWIKLKKGSNDISVSGGNVIVMCEFPIIR